MANRLKITTKEDKNKFITSEGNYCGKDCEFKRKMFQGYGRWLGENNKNRRGEI